MNPVNDFNIDTNQQIRARRYAGIQRRLFLAELVLGLLFLFALLWSGVAIRLRDMLPASQYFATTLFFTIISAAYSVLSFPLVYYRGLALPRHYGLSKENFRDWLGTQAKEGLLGWILGVIAILAIYALLIYLPDWWWLAATLFTALLSALISFIAPWFIMPLFFKAERLPVGDLRQRLESLAARANFSTAGIFTIDWSKKGETANAMFLGMGRSRRIILTDTLLKKYTPDEIETILAHELGHYRLGHIVWLLVLQSGLALIVFALTHLVLIHLAAIDGPFRLYGPSDAAGMPLLAAALLVFSLIVSPFLMAYSRHIESRADDFSVKLTGNPTAFAQALLRLHEQNLAEAEPGRWVEVFFYDHPPLVRRLARLRRMS